MSNEYLITIKPYNEGFVKPFEGYTREECTICSDNDAFTYKSWVKLGCDHYFHRHCIDIWIDTRKIEYAKCPLCQNPIKDSHNLKERKNSYNNFICFLMSFIGLIVILIIIYIIYSF